MSMPIGGERLHCQCPNCCAENPPFKVEYLAGHIVLMNAVCASCEARYWIAHDLLKLQFARDEREIEQIADAQRELAAYDAAHKL